MRFSVQIGCHRRLFLACSCGVIALLGGCADLRGIPQGLKSEQVESLSDTPGTLLQVLKVSDQLRQTYIDARNDNLDYKFWSAVPYIPLAGGAAGAIYYKASADVLAGIGLAAGTLAGLNTLINAKDNAAAYQAGVTALECTEASLAVFMNSTRQRAITLTLNNDLHALTYQIADAESVLVQSDIAIATSSVQAVNELKTSPQAMTTFSAAQKALSDELTTANAAANSAATEIDAFNTMPSFAARSILEIDQLVSAKITSGNVDFATLRAAITSSITEEIMAKTKAANSTQTPANLPKLAKAAETKAATMPFAKETAKLQTSISTLTSATRAVTNEVAITGVVKAESAATACASKF